MRIFLTLIMALGFCISSNFAQVAPDFWGRISPDDVVLSKGIERQHEPLRYKALTLDFPQISAYLKNAPREFSAAARSNGFQVVLPLADGKKETFAVVKNRVMDKSLEAKHPEIGTYAGISLNTPGMQVRITVTPGWGFQAMITRPDKGIEYIEPVAPGQNEFFMVYDRLDLPKDIRTGQLKTIIEMPPADEVTEQSLPRFALAEPDPGTGERVLGSPVNLKVYRFACAATGEFSQDNGGTKDLVFQKLTQFTNQLNAIYERDINIRLELIPESYDIIFLDPVTDPYTGTEVGGWMSQNPSVMAQYLGSASKYDIGHVFARYIDGSAIGVAGGLCCTQFKGRGCSAWYGPPYGDAFFAIVGQEIGHQWNSGHTFNQCQSDSQFNYDSACEPGSGSTIMSYNGACGSNNIGGGGTALFYHACSIAEIRRFYTFQEGATCGSTLATNNTTPDVSTAYPAITFIPVRTPFELTGTGTDIDGDDLTYSWDEIDIGPTSALGSPSGGAPIFRWFEPTTNPTRTFPRISTIRNNGNDKTEVLPTYNRDVTFVFVARDNKVGGGGVSWDTVELRATTLAGPFLVTYPNSSSLAWKVGEYQTVTWDVANTNAPPVNCQTVNIKLSTDDGNTYPITLASNVPNSGKYCIQVPNNTGTNMRIRVEAADNVFFDISNFKFTIEQPTAAISLCSAQPYDFACLPGVYNTNVSTVGLGGLTDPITLTATGLPNGVTATFIPNPVMPGSNALMSLSFPANTQESVFDVTIEGNTGSATASAITTISVINNDFAAFGPTSPANGEAGVNKQPPLYWSTVPDADYYDVELASNPSFESGVMISSKVNVAVDSFQVPVPLEEGKVYYWRVRPKNDCGAAAWSPIQVFVVAIQSCALKEATDLPKNITANGTPTVESVINIPNGGTINDVNVITIQGNHSFFMDLEAHLIGPSGTDVLLWKSKCSGFNGSFNFGMDDGATGPFGCPPPNSGQAFKPASPLNAFIGQNSTGQWKLQVTDNMISSGGSLANFVLEICSSVSTDPPLIVKNDVLMLAPGTNAAINDVLLKAEDTNNGPDELLFTLMSIPKHGELLINGVLSVVGSQFTQADINNGAVRYYDYGLNLGQDSFDFAVTDGEGGLAKGTFVVQPFAVGTQEPNAALSFELAPNPANSIAVLSLSSGLSDDAQVKLVNMAGQVVKSWSLAEGAYSLRLELADLPKGVYAVSLETDSLKSVKKLVIQ
ncbi:MAG: cadherin-like domain-containing protein [Saprospiraceae bacterium]